MHKNLIYLEQLVNVHLSNIHTWLCANKLSLNIKKTVFSSPTKETCVQSKIIPKSNGIEAGKVCKIPRYLR